MARNAYHSGVRVGNWYENRLMEEAMRKSLESRKSAERNFWELHAALLEEGIVSVCPDGLLHFGDSVLIHAPVVEPRRGKGTARLPPTASTSTSSCHGLSLACTLAATPSREALMKNYYEETAITASPDHHRPMIKNVFTIQPRRSKDSLGSVLCYGDPFDLTHTTHGGHHYYVTSPVGTALHSGRESRRQEVLLKEEPSSHCVWKLQPSDRTLRMVMEGEPAEVGARVLMVQTMTNQPLVVEEEFPTTTIYGQEQQVSVGVVNRATTRAASTFALLTWTRHVPENSPGELDKAEIPEVEDLEKGREEDKEREIEREKRMREEQREEMRKEREEREEEAVERLRLALQDISNDSSHSD
ncbi:uncharacterized protein LOC135094675 [Scylla paramamosain]|uniref:uncharacterized protein LOC135094675 n=1 Tax=Scylla paramamosain TaxID=85552 RepID=UPI0030829598